MISPPSKGSFADGGMDSLKFITCAYRTPVFQLSLLFWYVACSLRNSDTIPYCSTHDFIILLDISMGASCMVTFIISFPGSLRSTCLPYKSKPWINKQSFAAWCAHTTLTFLGYLCGTTCTPRTSDSSTLLTMSSYSFSVRSLTSTLTAVLSSVLVRDGR